jgi:PHS family inorganic phosphate transporter-like MFS transporter
MLIVVYWDGKIPQSQESLINLSLLVGTFFGQFIVGVLADRYGRKRLYGIELLILTVATVLMAVCNIGALKSTNRLAWILAWRFIMGIGIGMLLHRFVLRNMLIFLGGDYPLSVVITAEYVNIPYLHL